MEFCTDCEVDYKHYLYTLYETVVYAKVVRRFGFIL
jgi:hypothetical protein